MAFVFKWIGYFTSIQLVLYQETRSDGFKLWSVKGKDTHSRLSIPRHFNTENWKRYIRWSLRFQPIFTFSKNLAELHYAFNHLKAQANSNGKSCLIVGWVVTYSKTLHFQPFQITAKFKWEYNLSYFVCLYSDVMHYHCAPSNSATKWPGLH
jgi:hypothetical protein